MVILLKSLSKKKLVGFIVGRTCTKILKFMEIVSFGDGIVYVICTFHGILF